MRRSKIFISEKIVELFTLEIECPFCEKVRVYRSTHESVFETRCKCCKKEFLVDHGLEDYCVLREEYFVRYVGDKDIPQKKLIGQIFSKETHVIKDVERHMVRFSDLSTASVPIHDLEIDRELNKENWKKEGYDYNKKR